MIIFVKVSSVLKSFTAIGALFKGQVLERLEYRPSGGIVGIRYSCLKGLHIDHTRENHGIAIDQILTMTVQERLYPGNLLENFYTGIPDHHNCTGLARSDWSLDVIHHLISCCSGLASVAAPGSGSAITVCPY